MFTNTLGIIDKIKNDIQKAILALDIIIHLGFIGYNIYTIYKSVIEENYFLTVINAALVVLLIVMCLDARNKKDKKAKAIKRESKKYYKFFKKLKKHSNKIVPIIMAITSFVGKVSTTLVLTMILMATISITAKFVTKYIEAQLEALKNAFIEDVRQSFDAVGEAWGNLLKKKDKKPQPVEAKATLFDDNDLRAFDEISEKGYDQERDEQLIIL